MANSNMITGRVTITLAGFGKLSSKEGAKLNMGGVEREAVLGDGGVIGFSEKTAEPSVECTIAHSAKLSLSDLNAITNETLTFETDTGVQFVLGGAYLKKPCELNKGEISLQFGAMNCQEVKKA